jgi:hypothetical protein
VATTNSTQINLATLTPRQLLSLYSQILTELIARQVTRSRNPPAGDYAELLVAEHYGGKLASGSATSYDVVVSGGRTIQVKSLVVVDADKRSHSYSRLRTFDFDACVFVVFDSVNYRVVHAIEIESIAVEAMARDAKCVAGRRVNVKQVLACEDARDLTKGLQAAQDFIDEHRTLGRLGK